MKIDITPIIEVANELEAICLQYRNIDALYKFVYPNGEDLSTMFDAKSLSEFRPSITVSEMINIWEEGILRRYAEALEAVKTKLHPTETFEREITTKFIGKDGIEREFPTGKTETVRVVMDEYQIKYYEQNP